MEWNHKQRAFFIFILRQQYQQLLHLPGGEQGVQERGQESGESGDEKQVVGPRCLLSIFRREEVGIDETVRTRAPSPSAADD